jgi:hypothetical protein
MIYLMKLKNGEDIVLTQSARDGLARLLTAQKDERPEFIEISSTGAIISLSSIAAIIPLKKELPQLLSQDEELKVLRNNWKERESDI